MKRRRIFGVLPHSPLLVVLFALIAAPLHAQVRIKDITDLDGARANQLYGFGLVVGLDSTGSRSTFTQQVAVDMLQKLNVTAQIFTQSPADNVIRSTSISAVMVTAEIGPFNRKGSRIDGTVGTLDDTRSLQGGTLVMTPLRGADGEVYAVAQGPLSIGGFAVGGQAARAQKNQVNTGRIPNGGIVEKEALGDIFAGNKFRLLLKEPDYNTARMIAKAINVRHPESALIQDGGAVVVCVPFEKSKSCNAFVSEVGLFDVIPDVPARVVINERTGTVVAGENVTLSATAVASGNLFIFAAETPLVSQPGPFGGGQTAVVPRTTLGAQEQGSRLNVVPKTTTVAELARGLNSLGVSPRDLITIFQALKQAGALHAEIVIQ
jgi:flagellar P-ring protein precursor FlgI